ncbi:MAG: ankyrin repeat domain-containing protein [Chloroflexota bacterium]|nr:ankyrin repeat domain-containing protein [Chloroflexota bacterium]
MDRYLVAQEANMTATSELNDLIEAIKAGDTDRARAIARARPELRSLRDDDGLLPATEALYRGQDALARDLLPGDGELSVFEAATFARDDRLGELLASEPDVVRGWSPDGFTLLHLALFSGSPDTVRRVLAAGADLEAPSRSSVARGVRPIHTAAFVSRADLGALLIDAGADVDGREAGGFTALHAAAENADVEMVRLLLSRGADPRLTDDRGRTAADIAREKGAREVEEVLRGA